MLEPIFQHHSLLALKQRTCLVPFYTDTLMLKGGLGVTGEASWYKSLWLVLPAAVYLSVLLFLSGPYC